MTTFTIEITDASKLAGITAAREAYNASLPSTIIVKQPTGEMLIDHETEESYEETIDVIQPNPALIETDAEYVQFVMDKAAESYSKQYGV
jgi:hypothetical protein